MGNSCLKLKRENYPKKIEIIARERTFVLRSAPDSFLALESMINCSAKKYISNSDPLTYYLITYTNKKAGFQIKILNDKSYRAALRASKCETLTLHIEPQSYRNMVCFSLKKTGILGFDSLLTSILPRVSELEENVASLLQAYDAILKFSRCFCMKCSYPSFQMALTSLLLVILSDCKNKGSIYSFLPRFPFIEFNTENLGSEGTEAATYWTNLVIYLEKVLPIINEVCGVFQRMDQITQFELDHFLKSKEIDLNILLENSKSIAHCKLVGAPLEVKIKNIYKDIEEASSGFNKPQNQKLLKEVHEMIKLSRTSDADAAIGLFGLKSNLRLTV